MTEIQCPHCDAHNFMPEDDFDTTCGSCGDDMNRAPNNDEDTSMTRFTIGPTEHFEDDDVLRTTLYAEDVGLAKFSESEHAYRVAVYLQEGFPVAELAELIDQERQYSFQRAELIDHGVPLEEFDSSLVSEDGPGDIYEVDGGFEIVTEHGRFFRTDEQALKIITGLATMLHARLARPWSNEDDSTILTRGRATRRLQEKYGDHVKFDLETEAIARELRRPAGTDAELVNIADHYA